MTMTKTVWRQVREQLGDIEGRSKCSVGIPTFNNAKTVEPVVTAIKAGIGKVCPSASVLVVNADAGSQDGTPETIKQALGPDIPTAFVQHLAGGVLPDPSHCTRSQSQGCPVASMHFERSLRSRKRWR